MQCAGSGGRETSCNESLNAPPDTAPPDAATKVCTDGDVLLMSDGGLMDGGALSNKVTVSDYVEMQSLHKGSGAPFIFVNGSWAPICEYHFRHNNFGATTFCKKLGFERGIPGISFTKYAGLPPAYQLGACGPGEDLLNCSYGKNERQFTDTCGKPRLAIVTCDSPRDESGIFSTCAWRNVSHANTMSPPPPPVFGDLDVEQHTARFPAQILTCLSQSPNTSSCSTLWPHAYERIVAAVAEMYDSLPTTCDRAVCPQGDLAGCVLRLAGHDLMDFVNGTGGSDGCLDFNDTDNAGLFPCLAGRGEFGLGKTLESVYTSFCSEVSLADFVVIAAEALMMRTRDDWLGPHLNRSLALDLSNGFRFGRTTAETCSPAPLPNAELACDAVNDNFVQSLGLTWKESAALMGVHTLGRARRQFSGYEGWWNEGPEGRSFNNSYYISLLAKGWEPKNMGPGKNQWVRSDGGSDVEMMLNSDMCLLYETPNQAQANLDTCCAWTDEGPKGLGSVPSQCLDSEASTSNCCVNQLTCNDELNPQGSAANDVKLFAHNESAWLTTFVQAWRKVTTNGFHSRLFDATSCAAAVPPTVRVP